MWQIKSEQTWIYLQCRVKYYEVQITVDAFIPLCTMSKSWGCVKEWRGCKHDLAHIHGMFLYQTALLQFHMTMTEAHMGHTWMNPISSCHTYSKIRYNHSKPNSTSLKFTLITWHALVQITNITHPSCTTSLTQSI